MFCFQTVSLASISVCCHVVLGLCSDGPLFLQIDLKSLNYQSKGLWTLVSANEMVICNDDGTRQMMKDHEMLY